MGYTCDIPKKFCNVRGKGGECKLGIICQQVIEQCEGCQKVENDYCKAYINPAAKWAHGRECPAATHIFKEERKFGKRRLGQQKQQKRQK